MTAVPPPPGASLQFHADQCAQRVGVLIFHGDSVNGQRKIHSVQTVRASFFEGPTFPTYTRHPLENIYDAALRCAREFGGPATELMEVNQLLRVPADYFGEMIGLGAYNTTEPFSMSFRQSVRNGTCVLTWWFMASSWTLPRPIAGANGQGTEQELERRGAHLAVERVGRVLDEVRRTSMREHDILSRALVILQGANLLAERVLENESGEQEA